MANEFDYSADLSILHPSIDPKVITAAITELHPRIEALAGSDRRDTRGNLITPPRKTMYSHWLAPLHAEERLFSGDTELSEFILNRLGDLKRHRNLFHELDKEGQVTLMIALYTKSNYSADVLQADALKQCGDLGIDLELNIYSGNRQESN
jgi:hypothetical protein